MKSHYRVLLLLVALFVIVAGMTVFAQDSTTHQAGETVLLQGQVLDSEGNPIEGAVVEIWQADVNGHYDHPQDAGSSALLDTFQYFGTATTDADGNYAFRTVKPAAYESRPPHIHVKVKLNGQEVLTTQFYFDEDLTAVAADGVGSSADATLFLQTEDSTEASGASIRIATGNLVLDLNGSGADTVAVTAAQTEGPYYPVVDFSGYDNDLTSTAENDPLVTPALVAQSITLLNLNTATADELLTIPGMSNRMVREFEEYRPYVSILQFRREIGKYVDDAQVAAYEAYVYVPVDFNASDAETLKQLPGVDDAVAGALIAARPYASRAAFLEALAGQISAADAAGAVNYLVNVQ